MRFNKIFINNFTDIYNLGEGICELNFDSNLFVGSYEYKNYIKFIIKDFIEEEKCFNDTFEGKNDFFIYK